jgi:hypothetical protein
MSGSFLFYGSLEIQPSSTVRLTMGNSQNFDFHSFYIDELEGMSEYHFGYHFDHEWTLSEIQDVVATWDVSLRLTSSRGDTASHTCHPTAYSRYYSGVTRNHISMNCGFRGTFTVGWRDVSWVDITSTNLKSKTRSYTFSTMPVYVGCYVDYGYRVFNQGPKKMGYTVSTCAVACSAVPTLHMALQASGWCFCGSAVHLGDLGDLGDPRKYHGPFIQTLDSECGEPSPQFGSSESPQRGGGGMRNAVYLLSSALYVVSTVSLTPGPVNPTCPSGYEKVPCNECAKAVASLKSIMYKWDSSNAAAVAACSLYSSTDQYNNDVYCGTTTMYDPSRQNDPSGKHYPICKATTPAR